eukprot:CAMPEP_0171959944 /NCGR_PEP_ID=MMETSP0993-20121228/151978_1 /TAXON_ID=483369 /ORGANISM="non described non described, Strain CCMP2098" /LENGTH=47 /DNA_ID= /DNA_START= /DNA_END= /DNA_ORIENTATION=
MAQAGERAVAAAAFTVAVSTREQAALRVDLFAGLSDGGQARLGAAAS